MGSLILGILFCCNGRSDSVLFVLYYPLVPTHHSVKFEVSGHPNPGMALYSPVAESLGRIVKRIVRRGAEVKEDIVHILCVGHFVIRAKHSLELKGQVIWDLSLSGRYLPQSATQPQNYDQSESKRTHVVSLYE